MSDRLLKAKSIKLLDYLKECGHEAVRESSRSATFFSPLRSEKKPSFHVNLINNRWTDYGPDVVSGDTIDFVSAVEGVTISEAIDILLKGDKIRTYHKPLDDAELRIKAIEVIEVRESVEKPALIEYMEGVRMIPIEVVNRYCSEVTFQFASSLYARHWGVGIPTDLGGWAIRNSWFKGATRDTSVSTVATKDTLTVCLYEGFIDWLSWVVLNGEPKYTSVVMNSLVNVPMIIDRLHSYDTVRVYFDNDSSADDKIEYILSQGIGVEDMRGEYSDFNDINDFLVTNFDI